MSNPFKAVGKVFKAVVKVAKKVALPALAIGAAVLTGGAALGLLPSVGSMLGAGGLGLSAGLTSVISSAGTGALTGMIGSAITGKSVLKGAVLGGVTGAALGGIGQLVKPAASAGAGIASKAGEITNPLASQTAAAPSLGMDSLVGSNGIGSMVKSGASSLSITNPASSLVTPIANGVGTATSGASALAAPVKAAGGGIGSFLKDQPYLLPSVLQGIGAGISSSADAKAQRQLIQDKYDRIADNYAGGGAFYSGPATSAPTMVAAQKPRMIWRIDPKTGNLYQEVAQ